MARKGGGGGKKKGNQGVAKPGKAGKKAKSAGGVSFRSGGGGGFVGDAPASQKRQARREAREATRSRRHRLARGGEEAIADTRQRLKSKALQKQLARLSASAPERCALLRETAELHAEAGRNKQAIEAYQEALQLQPEDPGFQMRARLLCLLMDEARGDEARQLVEGPLFEAFVTAKAPQKPPVAATSSASSVSRRGDHASQADEASRNLSAVSGAYSHALLDYISVRVLREDKDPAVAAASETRLADRLQWAHKVNPFVAEFIAFAPAFEPYFEVGAELPPDSACGPGEGPMLAALRYLVGLRQVSVWLETDDEVRRFVRCSLFEEDAANGDDEKPPFEPLPSCEQQKKESPLLSRWKRGRDAAMELWAEEMSMDGSDGAGMEGEAMDEEGGEEESCAGDSSMSEAASEDFAGREERSGLG